MSKRKKKKEEELDLSVITDVKDPFSWANFWDEQIVGRIKAVKQFLDEKGILFFLTSPFQYRNRLITKLIVIVLGILIGVVPRSLDLLQKTKARNAASEFSSISKSIFSAQNITVKPLTSGQYKKTHVLVFEIKGSTDDGVPSTSEGYDVKLTSSRGVSDAEHVKYKYTIVPVSADVRLLVMYVDNTKQNDETGIYNVDVRIKGTKEMQTPMEVVLSNSQKTTDIYTDGVINLSALSEKLSKGTETEKPIETAEDKLKDALAAYKNHEERLLASGYGVRVSTQQLEEYVKQYSVLTDINDKSTTKDLGDFNGQLPEYPTIISGITIDGTEYTNENQTTTLETGSTAATELPTLSTAVDNVVKALTNLNTQRYAKYRKLREIGRVLNKEVSVDDMVDGGKVDAYRRP